MALVIFVQPYCYYISFKSLEEPSLRGPCWFAKVLAPGVLRGDTLLRAGSFLFSDLRPNSLCSQNTGNHLSIIHLVIVFCFYIHSFASPTSFFPFTYCLFLSLIHTPSHSPMSASSLLHPSVCSFLSHCLCFIYSSPVHLLTQPVISSFFHSLFHWFTHSLTQACAHSFIHSFFLGSLIYPTVHIAVNSFIPSSFNSE